MFNIANNNKIELTSFPETTTRDSKQVSPLSNSGKMEKACNLDRTKLYKIIKAGKMHRGQHDQDPQSRDNFIDKKGDDRPEEI